jgi:amino acid adenylation domain-containing protein
MMNHMQAKIDDLQLTEKSIVAQNASHTFDISVWQFFSALITGGKTVIFPGALVLEPGKFVAHIVKHDVNILEVVPSYLSLLLDYLGNQDTLPLALQYLLVTGEELKPLLVRKWFERYPGIKMVNAYGPTEASDDITHYIMDKALGASERERIPIGKPLPNMNIYIVDDSMQLCPIGVKGEICVAGVGVGRGYIGDEAKTKKVFMEDPFVSPLTTHHSPLTKNRLYKTGDLCRWLPDGNIEFFGRKDYQVKIRGFRIELGEIENRLLTHDAVKEAVVLDKEDEQGNKYLCAYVVLHPHPIAGPAELKEYLAERLPDYMVPAYFLQLETMPLTPNGKIDRKALPEPEGGGPAAEYVPPRDRVEAKLVEIWAEVLGKEKGFIGIEDNFFRLGGHSLRAVALVSKIHQALNVKLTLAVLFKTPTVKDLAQHIKGAAEDRYAAIEPVEKRDYYELSSTQRRLYILHQMDPGGTVYNMATVVRLPGAPDIERLEKTFIKLIDRHESLRTSFHMEGSRPVQRVHGIVDFKVENYDLQKNSAEAAAVFHRPFNLAEAPLLKVGVLKTVDGAFVLAAVMHHIISDGVSLRILEKDFSALYRDGSAAPLRIQYKDFSQWQNSRKQDAHIKTQEDFWLKEFSGEIPVLELCLDYPRPAVQSFAGGILRFEVGPMETRQIKSLARQEGVTLFMLMLAATYTWLAKLSGQEDIVVGTPVAGRRHADLEPVIGMFVNTLPLRAHPAGGKSFLEFLAEVKEKTLDAFENQEYQFEDLVENAPVNRDTARNPLFDVMYTLIQVDETPGAGKPRDEKNITESQQEINEEATAKFDLNLELTVTEKLAVSLEYCRKLFKRETIERFAVYFKQLIGVIGKSPMALMAHIEIITAREKKQLLYDFNDTATDYPVEKPIHFLFEEQESKTPDCVGLVGDVGPVRPVRQVGPISLTYRHLNERSDQFAGMLNEKGVLPDTIVGIMMDRSVEMMIAIYGILKAGGAYLPIDPEYPQERIDYMLKDSGATILLTDYEREIIVNCQLLIVNCKLLKGCPRRGLHHSNRLAYIIYTSGSTGKPKGVMIPHRAVHNFIQGMAAVIDFAPGKIILALTTICFDIFLLETLLPLSRGMRVVIADEKHQADMALLEKLIIKTNIEMLQATPTRMRLFLSPKGAGAPAVAGPVSCLRNLKEIMVGGEAFPTKLLEDLQRITSVKIYNMYGPTETTVWSAVKDVTGKRQVYIGGPIVNTQIYIFNSKNYLQPIGVAGELCIGGMGLALGYLNRPELTNKSFAGVKGGLFQKRPLVAYKTGDLARWLAPGEIEFLGRIDNQVKIRGFRIETEEIANCLVKHPHVKEAVVIVRENNSETYLGAYIVTAGADVTTEELNRYLARSLPAYMIPAVFVKLEKIPLTLNGKLDRRALPVEEFTPGAIYRAPRNQIDEKLTEIWEQVLGIAKEVIGIDHDFFELGGQSMKAIQFIAGANRENFNISIIDVFKYKTIAALSDYILSLPGINDVKAIAESMSRQNPDFIPDTYPSYFPCVLGAIRERICYENQLQLSKGIFVMADGTALLALGYPEDSSLQDKLNYMEFPFARRSGNFKPLSEIIGYTTRIKRFSSLEKEMKYCSARLNKKELVLLTGTTYFLNYSPDYHMEPAQWLKKMDDLFAQYDKSKKLDLVGHIFVLVDIVEDGYILYDSTYNYYGKVPRENLHQAVKGNSAIEISKSHRSYNAYRPYQVIEVERNRSVHIDDRVLILETMKKFVQLSVTPEIFKGKEKDNQYVAFLGIGAIKELARVIDRSLNEKDSLADLYRYTTTIINSWKYKYIFFRDFLMDFSTYFGLPREVFLGIEGTISHWHGLYTRIREKNDQEDELITVFNTAIKQVEKIYEEQATVFAGLEQTIKQMK